MVVRLEDQTPLSITDFEADAPIAEHAGEANLRDNDSKDLEQSQKYSDDALSINSILKSSEDSCAILGQVLDTRGSRTSLGPPHSKKKRNKEPFVE